MAKHNEIGILGEDIATMFLKKHGYNVFTRNFLRKSGEIDIVARKGRKWHFVEVKTFACNNLVRVSRESDWFRPEENVSREKFLKLSRVIQMFLIEYKVKEDWQIDVCSVLVDENTKKAKVTYIPNIIFE